MSQESASQPGRAAVEEHGARALREVASSLAELDDGKVVRPSTDPHAAAATALLVADFLRQPGLQQKLDALGVTPEHLTQLRHLSRAVIKVVTDLGGDYLSDAARIPGELVSRGETVRASVTTTLEKALPNDPEVQLWLEAIRLGHGVVDLVYDLRTLGELCSRHASDGAGAGALAVAVQSSLAAADAIEFALRSDETPEQVEARSTVARLWTLFRPAYDRAAAAGRELTREDGRERQFPPLALVASHRRARRRPLSLLPAGAASLQPSTVRKSSLPRGSAQTSNAGGLGSPRIPGSPALPKFGDVELIEADSAGPARTTGHDPFPTLASSEPESWSDTRIKKRHEVEIEVGIASESNLYLGFTENLSAAGVFIATYASKPIGAHVEVTLAFPSGDVLRVPGVVKWLRGATTDGWPGMGVQFEGLSPEDDAKIRKFLLLRDPLFYDD